jgi:hypothetical protein
MYTNITLIKNNNQKINLIKSTLMIVIGMILVLINSACDVSTISIQNEVETVPVRGPTHSAVGVVATPSEAPIIQPSDTPQPTKIRKPQRTEILVTPSEEMLQPGLTQAGSNYQYNIQAGSPVYLPNIFHPESGCSWLGVAGQVFGEDTEPVIDIVVEAGGVLEGGAVFALTLTGLAPDYGIGGYEIYLADHGINSQGTVWIQLFNLSGKVLSPQIYFDTFDACDKNLVLVNFTSSSSGDGFELFLPFIGKHDAP